MASKQKVTGNLAVSEQQRVIVIEAIEKPQDLKLRVAAYTRVSSDSADQLNSFAAQNRYYTALISSKENRTMVDIYADRGITGTSVEKRDDFQLQIHLTICPEHNGLSGGHPGTEVSGDWNHL